MAQITLAEGSAASTPSSGNVALYAKTDGLLYAKDDAGDELLVSGTVTLLTAVATTSGTSHDFSIPAGAKEITIGFSGVSLSGTSDILVQGNSETSGYVSSSGTNLGGLSTSTSGFVLRMAAAASIAYGHMTLSLVDPSANEWVSSHSARMAANATTGGGGNMAFAAELTSIRITTVNGSDTFDAGKVNVSYKF